jgi:hypothetical protein
MVDLVGRKLGSFFGMKKGGKFRQGAVLRRTGTWWCPEKDFCNAPALPTPKYPSKKYT